MVSGLAVTNHVLSPRIKAVNMCIQGLRGLADAVYDVTIAYSNTGEETAMEEYVERRPAPGMPGKQTLFSTLLGPRSS